MKEFSCTQGPAEIYGLQKDLLPHSFWRLPQNLVEQIPANAAFWAQRPVGGRVRFRTNSRKINVTVKLKTNDIDWAIPLSGSAGADVYLGSGPNKKYAGVAAPKNYVDRAGFLAVTTDRPMKDVTINLPRNAILEDVLIEIEKEADLQAPTAYTIQRPLVFYGSSITQGGCASRPGNAYPSLVAGWLDADFINLGFSGSARGEPVIADYISTVAMSAFIYDYDHNSPSVEHLAQTHQPFFHRIRAAQPKLPVIILSRPDFDSQPEGAAQRRQVIFETFKQAKAAGDNHVYFIDGETLFGQDNREFCTIDGCHPNDLGFMRMAQRIFPVLKASLGL